MDKRLSLEARYENAKQAMFRAYYEATLNPPQRQAVCTTEGPLLVLAGAGSGKTTVLVRRIVHLVRYGKAYTAKTAPADLTEETVVALEGAVGLPAEQLEEILPVFISEPCPPWAVLAITFTNKAAREIKERLAAALSDEAAAAEIWAGTFHAVCMRILRRYASLAGYAEGFTIYDTDDQKRLVSQCMKELQIDEKVLSPRDVLSHISRAKDSLQTAEDFADGGNFRMKQIGAVYRLYEKRLLSNNALDFDDIIMRTVFLLQENPEVLSHYQRQFRYVLVDEFQDTNFAQLRLTELLSGGRRNLMVVGDDDQSIYRFRGATVENILQFDAHFPDATVIKLEQNYRSTKNILAAANSIIAHNDARHEKALWCDKEAGAPIAVYEAPSPEAEAKYIIDKTLDLVVKDKYRYRDVAVLYRLNELSRGLESAFIKAGIPYRVLGGQRFFDRKEIRDIVAYLQVISNLRDNQRLKRIANEPKRQIGDTTLEAVETLAAADGISMYEVMEGASRYPALARVASRLVAFTDMMNGLRCGFTAISTLISEVTVKTGYADMLRAEGEAGAERLRHIDELVSAALEYEERTEGPTLAGFLEEVALVSDVDKYDETADAVVLMTVHSAKGLEFPHVFLAGMEDGVFPSQRNLELPDELAEERRLAYVAVTRAKERLFVTAARERLLYGQTRYARLSRFIREEADKSTLAQEIGYGKPKTAESARRAPFVPQVKRPLQKSAEWDRPAAVTAGTATRADGPRAFGVKRFDVGARVMHEAFGAGTVKSVKEMGGDYLYEVSFDAGITKRLMATYARLRALSE